MGYIPKDYLCGKNIMREKVKRKRVSVEEVLVDVSTGEQLSKAQYTRYVDVPYHTEGGFIALGVCI